MVNSMLRIFTTIKIMKKDAGRRIVSEGVLLPEGGHSTVPRTGWLPRNLFFCGSGGWKSQIKVLAR